MIHDRRITISTAGSRKSTHWPASTLMWSELVTRLQTPIRSTETLEEYLALPKSRQDDLKDVGGFVAGTFHGTRRKANAVKDRCILTLDLDNIPAGQTDAVLQRVEALGCAYAVYSTRKHRPDAPRLRVLLPTDRETTPDEYEPLARKMAEYIGIDMADPTTFDVARLMYDPSCSADGQYVYLYGDKPFLSADGLLGQYRDWRNVAEWPQVPGEADKRAHKARVQKDPTEKGGIVGAFCRVYDIPGAIDHYLFEQYEPDPNNPTRYTYTGGSTTGGAVVYDDGKFLYSHHATDPCSGLLVNAFDLVRRHLFDGQDDNAKPDTPPNKLPSFVAMCQVALKDETVARVLNEERYKQAVDAFAKEETGSSATQPEAPDVSWMQTLDVNSRGDYAKTIDNVFQILRGDPQLRGKLAFDEFSNRGLVLGALPWNQETQRRDWKDQDDSGLRQYLEKVYGITGKEKIYDAITNVAMGAKINDVKDYLCRLQWDGIPRLDTLLIDFFGADDTSYTRAVTRKFLVAAVARVYQPGVKFDTMPVLSGPQGCGKSTFLSRLGGRWYTDSLTTFEGKEAAEIIQGNWLVEVGELNAMNRSEINAVKQFLSRTDDVYREPYGRRTGRYPRRCVFAGTTNDAEYLRDRTGNRRFWPIDLNPDQAKVDPFTGFTGAVIDQVWAEAKTVWEAGEPLYLPRELESLARTEQDAHMESNPKEGIIVEFLGRELPADWDHKSLLERRMYWNSNVPYDGATEPRQRVCALEIWCECFGNEARYFGRREAVEINGILGSLPGWKRSKNGIRCGAVYGLQKAFLRC